MKTISLTLAALVISGSIVAAQTSTTPRIDDEGINMDVPPPPAREPGHPADGYTPNAAHPPNLGATTGLDLSL